MLKNTFDLSQKWVKSKNRRLLGTERSKESKNSCCFSLVSFYCFSLVSLCCQSHPKNNRVYSKDCTHRYQFLDLCQMKYEPKDINRWWWSQSVTGWCTIKMRAEILFLTISALNTKRRSTLTVFSHFQTDFWIDFDLNTPGKQVVRDHLMLLFPVALPGTSSLIC